MVENRSVHPEDRVLLAWSAREWVDHEKGPLWWTIAAVLVIAVVMVSLIYGSWTTAVVFALLGGTYYLFSHERARIVPVQLTEFGVHFGDKFWQYAQLKQFWIVYNPPHVTTLHLELAEGRMGREIVIQMEDLNPLDVRDTLAKQIPEAEGRDERPMDTWARIFKI